MKLRRTGTRAIVAVLAVALTGIFLAGPASADLGIVNTSTDRFPDVSVTVSVPGDVAARVGATPQFTVTEGGQVRETRLVGLPTDELQVVIVLDTSGSMAGAPMEAARQAAAGLVSKLPPSARVAVIGFGTTPYAASPFTTNLASATASIQKLTASGETALYDAVRAAAGAFPEGASARRAIVLLTDGHDTSSRASLDSAVTALRGAGASFDAVALETPDIDTAAMSALAGSVGSSVINAATPGALSALYDAVAARLAYQYRLTYTSSASGDTQLRVSLAVPGGPALETAGTVKLPRGAAAANAAALDPVRPTVASSRGFRDAPWFAALGIAMVAIALAAVGSVVFRPRPLSNQLRHVTARRKAPPKHRFQQLKDATADAAERTLDRRGRRRSVSDALERAGISMRAGELVVLVAVATVATFMLLALVTLVIVALVIAALVPFAAIFIVRKKAERRKAKFIAQLDDTLPLIAGTLRAGFGLSQAIDSVARESQAPTAEEFGRVVVEVRLGRDIDDALAALADRLDDPDLRWVVQAIDIHRHVGGDLAEVLDNVAGTLRERNRLRGQVQALSGEGRLSAGILLVLPIAMAGYISVVNPEYFAELTGSSIGRTMLAGSGVLMVIGAIWMKRLTRLVF